MQENIERNEIDFEVNPYDYFTCMYYKGEPFTGTLVDGNTITQFKNGNAHGKSVEYRDYGQLAEESYFENGDYVSFKSWHVNGTVKSEWPGGKTDSLEYDMDGNVIRKNSDFFYKNGNFRKRSIPHKTEFYNEGGELIVMIQYNLTECRKPVLHINKEKFSECYSDLYFERYPYISGYKDNIGDDIIGWFWYLLSQSEEDKKFAVTAITELLQNERNRSTFDLEWILQSMHKVDAERKWRIYYSEITEFK